MRPLAGLDPGHVVVLMPLGIGDMVIATPLVRALRRRFHRACLVALANPGAEAIFAHTCWFDRIVTVKYPWHPMTADLRVICRFIAHVWQARQQRWDLGIAFKGDVRENLALLAFGARRRVNLAGWPRGRYTSATPCQRAIQGAECLLTDRVAIRTPFMHVVPFRMAVAEALGCQDDRRVELRVLPDEKAKAQFHIDATLGKRSFKPIAIHPGASLSAKLWFPDRWADVYKGLVRHHGRDVFFIAGPDDDQVVDQIACHVGGPVPVLRPSLRELVAVIATCDALVCLDSCGAHIAAAVQTPFVALYGGQTPALFGPFCDAGRTLYRRALPCQPCNYRPRRGCARECMAAIDTDDVMGAVHATLA